MTDTTGLAADDIVRVRLSGEADFFARVASVTGGTSITLDRNLPAAYTGGTVTQIADATDIVDTRKTVGADNKSVTLDPRDTLATSTQYQVLVLSGARDVATSGSTQGLNRTTFATKSVGATPQIVSAVWNDNNKDGVVNAGETLVLTFSASLQDASTLRGDATNDGTNFTNLLAALDIDGATIASGSVANVSNDATTVTITFAGSTNNISNSATLTINDFGLFVDNNGTPFSASPIQITKQ